MHTIEIQHDAIPIVKSGLTIEKKRLEYNNNKFSRQLKIFEKKYKMQTPQFINKFNNGSLGDDEKWFDWLFAYKAQLHIKKKLDLINAIKI